MDRRAARKRAWGAAVPAAARNFADSDPFCRCPLSATIGRDFPIMRVECPPLPFAYDALEPHMSAETLRLHHDKHQKAYFDKLCGLVKGTEFTDVDLETIIASTGKGRGAKEKSIFNNAAQVWNHSFFWHSIAPGGGA